MSSLALPLFLAAVAAAPALGEILETVRPGDRLDISNFAGEIRISTWDENRLRIVADHRKGDEILLKHNGSVVRVRSASWDEASDSLGIADSERAVIRLDGSGQPGLIIYDVTVPTWLPVVAAGALTSVSVEHLQAPLEITLFQGDVRVIDCEGSVSVTTLAGDTILQDCRGPAKVRGGRGSVTVRSVEGNLSLETTSGRIAISDSRAGSVEALTVVGGITYEGSLPLEGTVSLATHAGGIELALPPETDATVSVRTLRGTFDSEFPPGDPAGGGFRFQIGTGRSILDLESFSGPIRIRRR